MQLNLPPGEGLYLWIDRVVEGKCDWEGLFGGCQASCFDGEVDVHGEGIMDADCPKCHGTGKRRVRVQGWCEVGIDELPEIDSASEYSLDAYGSSISSGWYSLSDLDDKAQDDLIKQLIAAHFAGTLPDGVAHIEEVDE